MSSSGSLAHLQPDYELWHSHWVAMPVAFRGRQVAAHHLGVATSSSDSAADTRASANQNRILAFSLPEYEVYRTVTDTTPAHFLMDGIVFAGVCQLS